MRKKETKVLLGDCVGLRRLVAKREHTYRGDCVLDLRLGSSAGEIVRARGGAMRLN